MYTLHACDNDGNTVQELGPAPEMNSALQTGSDFLHKHHYDAVHVRKNGTSIAVLNLTALMLDPPEYRRTGL